jgi:hypothetical protein
MKASWFRTAPMRGTLQLAQRTPVSRNRSSRPATARVPPASDVKAWPAPPSPALRRGNR